MPLQQMVKLLMVNLDERPPNETQKIIDDQLDEWLRDGIISRSDSPYASCVHVVSRKNGKPRVCVD